jgi:hypothetical protein
VNECHLQFFEIGGECDMSKDVSSVLKQDTGHYLRVLATGEIVKWRNFSEITQLYEIEFSDGCVSTIQSNRVSRQVTPEQAAEFGRAVDGQN